jgi:hypothetical protein
MTLRLTTVVALIAAAGAAPAADAPDLNANAALKYWRAFASLPRLDEKEQEKLPTMPLDARAKEIVASGEAALHELHNGAAVRDCAWGLTSKDGIAARIPECQATRQLAALARLRIRLRAEEGRFSEALDDAAATLTLARHIALDGTIVGVLVGIAIEATVMEALAPDLPRFPAPDLKAFARRLGQLPAGGSVAAALREGEEKGFLDWFVARVKERPGRDQLLELLERIQADERVPNVKEQARTFLASCGGTAQGVLEKAEAARPFYAEWSKKMDLPPAKFEEEWAKEQKALETNPVLKVLAPALGKCRQAEARREAKRALLAAALAVVADGPAALTAHPDPFGQGPFEMTRFDGGFELRSHLTSEGKPIALTVGRRTEK